MSACLNNRDGLRSISRNESPLGELTSAKQDKLTRLDNSAHPCFTSEAHERFARVHLPVAPRCNISCGFCDRRFSCVNESRPGVTAEVLSPAAALRSLEQAASQLPSLAVAGIAGPGDPLANPDETLATLALVRQHFPRLMTCVSTNGLALPALAGELHNLGVSHVTVTVNAATTKTAAQVYNSVNAGKATHLQNCAALLTAQEQGIRALKEFGLAVKINTVVLPGLNDTEIPQIAQNAAAWGADLMNCIALLPVGGTRLATLPALPPGGMRDLRAKAGQYLPQMSHCSRCRADAAGLLGCKTTLSDFSGLN